MLESVYEFLDVIHFGVYLLEEKSNHLQTTIILQLLFIFQLFNPFTSKSSQYQNSKDLTKTGTGKVERESGRERSAVLPILTQSTADRSFPGPFSPLTQTERRFKTKQY